MSNISGELTELLNRLDLSPSVLLEEDALAIEKNSSSSSGPGSILNADMNRGYPELQSSPGNNICRKSLLEEFSIARNEGKIYEARNNFFHDQLVEHFKRKQMMRVYGEPNEADPLKRKYRKKLWKYEELRQELEAAEEEFKQDATLLREDLREKIEAADAGVEDLVAKQRAAGGQAYTNGKPLAAKEIQALIARELGKMKEISKIRVRYARLRDSLVEKEVVFDALNILTPNLDRKDYQRLEAENFYYSHKLRMKEREAENLAKRRDRVSEKLKAIQRKQNNLSRIILKRRKTSEKLTTRLVQISKRKQVGIKEMKDVTKYFEKLEYILGLRLYPEVATKMKEVQDQHKEWLEKVATLVIEIKKNDKYLKALRPRKDFHETSQTDDEDTDENTSYRQKSRRPPLGGGFLQAL